MKHYYLKCKALLSVVLFAAMFLQGHTARSQTTLAAGDIIFTGFNATYAPAVGDEYSFVLLKDISTGTIISFTDRGYNGSGWFTEGSTESTVTWVSGSAIVTGTEVHIKGFTARTYNPATSTFTANGTVTLTEGSSSNGLSLSDVGDQIIAFQGGGGQVDQPGALLIAGLNYFYCNSSTSTAAWNSATPSPSVCTIGPNASRMPPGLVGGTSAFYTGTLAGNVTASSGRFRCVVNGSGAPFADVGEIRTAVMTQAKWELPATDMPSKCTFLGVATPAPAFTTHPESKTACIGATATFTIVATGATSYKWQVNGGNGYVDVPASAPYSNVTTATLTITGVTAAMNNYTYRAVATGTGSTNSNDATLTVPTISGTTTITNVACNGASTGAINLTPTGGTGPYTFNWGAGVTTEDRTGLAAGNYSVTITDVNGCTGTVNASVTQPASAVGGTTTITNVACNGASTGAINLTPTGGNGPYTFNWGAGVTTEDRTGLAAGNYSVTITDVNGCTGTVNASVTQPASAVGGTTTITNVACNGASTGAINLTPTGGNGPYTFNWGGGITTEDRTGLAAGNYSVTITDVNGCTGTVNASVTQPASAVGGTTTITNVACNGASTGAVNLTPTGGNGPYTFNWGGGITTEDRTGLAAGNYSVTITDVNGCTGTVNASVTQPASAVGGTTTITNVACNGASTGAINLTPTGGNGPYTFNWGAGVTTEDRTGLAAGNYSVTITDVNGCTGTVNASVNQPASAVSGSTVVTSVTCNGGNNGAINLTPTGGTGPYTFNWGAGVTTEDRTGLAAGNYSVTITDINGCTGTVNVSVTQPQAIVINNQPQNDAANVGGNAVFTVTATNTNSYQWQVSTNGTTWNNVANGGTNPVYAGATTNSLSLTGVPASYNGYKYKVKLVNGTNCETLSNEATLTVNNVLDAVDDDFSSVTINAGTVGNAGDVTLNDLYNGVAVNDANVAITVANNGGLTGVTINAQGILNVPASATQGTYIVTYSICDVANTANCSTAEATVVVSPPLGLRDFAPMYATVYPNPAANEVTVRISDISNYQNAKVTVFDLHGRRLMEKSLVSELEVVNISSLGSGTYLFNITSDGGKTTKRVIKH